MTMADFPCEFPSAYKALEGKPLIGENRNRLQKVKNARYFAWFHWGRVRLFDRPGIFVVGAIVAVSDGFGIFRT
jgi:hypothetical protein